MEKNTESYRNTIILNEKETAKRLSVGYSTLKRYRAEKKISHIRFGHRVGYTLKNITDFIEKNAVEA